MKKIAQLAALIFVVVGISACGKMGDLEMMKEQAVATPVVAQTQEIDETEQVVMVAPELDIMPHNSK
jgi:predicted small lipoprotein YifL